MKKIPAFLFLLIGCVQLAHAQATYSDPAEHAARVFELLNERLSLMEPVAAWKWQRHQPVSDPEREARVLDATAARASRMGIDPEAARHLLDLQIRYAREVEDRAIARWDAKGLDADMKIRDLASDLRPALDRIGEELLNEVYLALPAFGDDGFAESYGSHARQLVTRYQLSGDSATELLSALHALRASPQKTLSRIEATHVLRIAVTGDYAPFSLEALGKLEGADIELAREFASSVGAEPQFVRTTWGTLLEDYGHGRFDVAMGGISVTPERAARAAFAVPYRHGGKTSIARCAEAARFRTLEQIDRAAVRVAVNPGGTNERFARQHLTHASLVTFADNRTIFAALVNHQADVMITDDTEVELQTKLHPELCRANPATFDQSDKAWLSAPDDEFLARANAWLGQAISSGRVQHAFDAEISRLASDANKR
jgi:cyclohexadienyl dehydratase